jgi:hypothetical protein
MSNNLDETTRCARTRGRDVFAASRISDDLTRTLSISFIMDGDIALCSQMKSGNLAWSG